MVVDKLNSVLVPVDFSEESLRAVDVALEIVVLCYDARKRAILHARVEFAIRPHLAKTAVLKRDNRLARRLRR